MATLTQLCEGLKTRLDTISTIRAFAAEPDDVQVTQGKVVAYPIPVEGDDESFSGTERTVLNVVILGSPVQAAGRARGIQALEPYISRGDASDVKAAIEADKTLGAVADDLSVGKWSRFGVIEVGGKAYWGVIREVEVWH